MKKIIIELILKSYDVLVESWTNYIVSSSKGKITPEEAGNFARKSLNSIIKIIEQTDYSTADNYLIESYNLFSAHNLNLLEVSDFYSGGRTAVVDMIETCVDPKYDPDFLHEFIEEIFEQIFARYSMLHQEVSMKELSLDRDRLALKLEMNQQYLKNIMHSSDAAIMVVDENEKFIAWNKGAEDIFGYTEEEAIGKSSNLLLPPKKKYKDELQLIKKEVKEKGFLKIVETERKTKSGRIIPVELNITKLPTSTGDYIGRTVIIKDYTEVKKLQQQIDQSEKLAVIGQLAAGVAHEIGNPLTSISSIVQLLQRKASDTFFIEQLANLKANIDRISKIVRELVDFSRPPGYEKFVVHINDVVKTALGIVRYDKRVKKVQFETNLQENLPAIQIVPDQLLQVFVNILLNALDAINGTGRIEVNSYAENGNIFVDIKDNGCGIDEAIVSKIFEPFFTTKEVGKGTGLGLSVSYGIIKKFKGDILVFSEVNKGSCFKIKLPAN
jgi:PAS domain S-box-containing protein